MKLEFDHVFIIVKQKAEVADALVSLGMLEGDSNKHQGQGTSNRRFYFKNGMLEFLYIHDENEAIKGPARDLKFYERLVDPQASPYGIILYSDAGSKDDMPFSGWKYQPEYFKNGWAFHIGENSVNINEPLCIYVPFFDTNLKPKYPLGEKFKSIDEVIIYSPSISETLAITNSAKRLKIEKGDEHLIEITFNIERTGHTKDFRPLIPLIVNW